MTKAYIIYWSGTGNTEKMANIIADGVKLAGGEPEVLDVSTVKPELLDGVKAYALGCPSMGAEQLEESSMEPFVVDLLPHVSGKQIALFGSYGWGDCEWMRDWEQRLQDAGATILGTEGVTVLGEPDSETEEKLIEIGKLIVSNLD